MEKPINRREFLKLAGLFSLGLPVHQLANNLHLPERTDERKNILIIVYDALSAQNMSLYGYPRDTMPNLNRLAERAIVYHHHYGTANYTTPGTASLLTGAYPWTHRAFNLNATVERGFRGQNIFHAFADYHRMAYTHNTVANTLLQQFAGDIDHLIPYSELFFFHHKTIDALFKNDYDTAYIGWR